MLTDRDIFKIYNDKETSSGGVNKTLFVDHHFIDTPKELRILDIGFGGGELIEYLLKFGNHIYGIDINITNIEYMMKKGFANNTCLLYIDVATERIPFIDNFFDMIFILETVEHLSSPIHTLFEIKRVLKNGGQLIISFPPYEFADYIGGRHSHVYPGLFAKEPFERFMMQLYFKQHKSMMIGEGTVLYMFENIKDVTSNASKIRNDPEGQINIFKVVANNYTEQELYGHLK